MLPLTEILCIAFLLLMVGLYALLNPWVVIATFVLATPLVAWHLWKYP